MTVTSPRRSGDSLSGSLSALRYRCGENVSTLYEPEWASDWRATCKPRLGACSSDNVRQQVSVGTARRPLQILRKELGQ